MPQSGETRGIDSELTDRLHAKINLAALLSLLHNLAALLSLLHQRKLLGCTNESDFHVVARSVANVIAAQTSSTC